MSALPKVPRANHNKVPRANARIPVNMQIKVSAIDSNGRRQESSALLVNVSRGGAALQINFEASPKSDFTIIWQDNKGQRKVRAELRWQTCCDRLWRVGVESIDDRAIWNDLVYFACRNAQK